MCGVIYEEFKGTTIHSGHYTRPKDYEGGKEKVVVRGRFLYVW